MLLLCFLKIWTKPLAVPGRTQFKKILMLTAYFNIDPHALNDKVS